MEKKSCKCAETIKDLKNEINRLTEQSSNYELISNSHKTTNGELQTKLTAAEKKIKDSS